MNVLLYEADDESHQLEDVNVCHYTATEGNLTDVIMSMTVDSRSVTR